MPIFHYQAFDATGALHKGTQDAANESEVRQLLRSKDLFPKEIRTSRFTRKSNKAKTIKILPHKPTRLNKDILQRTRT